MIGLPKTTEFNKRIPKQKFYENMDISPALKKIFVEQVRIIYWKNKIAASTTNLAAGTDVTELEVFEVRLSSPVLDDSLLRQIDKEIPYHILFLLEYQGKYQAWIGYKEAVASGNKAFKVNGYYHTEWLAEDELPLKLEGLNVDAVYENFVRQIAGDKLKTEAAGESLKESVARDEQKQALQKQIATLQAKIRKEKQLNKQMQMNTELKKLKKELEAM
ncbi:TPA: DUF4391 domain-containing protein [Streptococcus equi subsp. zooepidemicus]|uniref:DUF4391 domain-containing protein n=1 Tax=Streptococcus equi TaxID=1336 RepID=UPI00030E5CFA|nr:DUF4391 domain-containing protein [Streptococcus equi]HEL0215958.1 DUF4391 domain-containing protein [Streptococcus equi subsp. zooepidemicus]HEL0219893.1 DUF4391 domain-containing protein [Streptococcus equi subsp. zooepidemicus]HEL0234140.1 DUF4391 domain-containing protein [Streptococcus equi subsp. zooepidemicus]HEL0253927.1 DUF4391 domain-containing protein [Streptococcus equi subsp. zooepidemicus]HEL0261713.1 DUF4391 domain-containing protein [Streptococcus equi subsp. zooepidemicus]